jgi:glycosyltransferase involved in cell wall biosynthesis
MRIGLVATGGLHPSGREQVMPVLLRVVKHLACEHEVYAFVLRHLPQRRTYPLLGAIVHDLGRPRGLMHQMRALLAALRDTPPLDVLHGYWANPAGAAATLAARRYGIPCVVSCSSGEFTSLPEIGYGQQRQWRTRATVNLTCRLADAVHVPSEYMATLARGRGITPVVIPLGVEAPAIAADRRPRPADGPPWRLLQVASLNPVKDQLTLLRALAVLRRRADVRLDLVGEDTMNGVLQRAAATLDVSDAVTFHGFRPQEDLPALYDAAHLYVQSSLHEGAGVAPLEAAAAGVPVVGTRVGFVSDWEGTASVAVIPRDWQALAAAILMLLNDPAKRQTLAYAARDWATRHQMSHSVQQLASLYRTLVART